MNLRNAIIGLSMLGMGTTSINCASTKGISEDPSALRQRRECDEELRWIAQGYSNATHAAIRGECNKARTIEQKTDELAPDYFSKPVCDLDGSSDRLREALLLTIFQLKKALADNCYPDSQSK